MHGLDAFYRLGFEKQDLIDDDVSSEAFVDTHVLIEDGQWDFVFEGYAMVVEFPA
jgi:hypothetical protein